jgi:uncharacterized protein HemX
MSKNLNDKKNHKTATVRKNSVEKSDNNEGLEIKENSLQPTAKEPVIETKETISDVDKKEALVSASDFETEIKHDTETSIGVTPTDNSVNDGGEAQAQDKPHSELSSIATVSKDNSQLDDSEQHVRAQLDKELDKTMDQAEELRKNEDITTQQANDDTVKSTDRVQPLDDYDNDKRNSVGSQVVPIYQDNYLPQIKSLKTRVNLLTLLLFGVIAVSGYGVYYFDKQKFGELTEIQSRVEQAKNTVISTEGKINELYSKIKGKDEIISSYLAANEELKKYNESLLKHESELTAQNEAMLQSVDKINIRLNNYEDRNPHDWLIAQSFFLVNNAQNIISYTDNMESALLNLNNADLLLVKIDDPNINQIREAISEDILALKKVAHIDIRGINYKIDSLYNAVDDMPLNEYLRKSNELQAGRNQSTDDIDDWKSNVLHSLKNFSSRFVEIRRRGDAAVNQYLSPEQSSILLQNIKTELLLSKVALFNRDENDFRHNLQEIVKHINDYFDVGNINVKSTLEVLDELLKCDIESKKPNYLSSFKLFNSFATEKFHLYKRQKLDATPKSDISENTSNNKSTNAAKEGSK